MASQANTLAAAQAAAKGSHGAGAPMSTATMQNTISANIVAVASFSKTVPVFGLERHRLTSRWSCHWDSHGTSINETAQAATTMRVVAGPVHRVLDTPSVA
jgi:hypothetical protein